MKRGLWLMVALAAVLANSGCWVYSLYPLAEKGQSVKAPELAGTWLRQEEKETLTIAANGDEYTLDYMDSDGKAAQLKASLVQLGTARFFDVHLGDNPPITELPPAITAHLLPARSIWKVSLEGSTLRLTALNDDWLKESLKRQQVKVAHKMLDDEVILLAATPELQKFVQRYADGAFPEAKAWVFKRK